MSERNDANQTAPEDTAEQASGYDASPIKGVRSGSPNAPIDASSRDRSEGLAHTRNPLIAQLNERWRVVDDPLQWILQRKKGNPRNKNSGWRSRSFCRTREALLRCIREYCCSPDKGELRYIREYNGIDKAALQKLCDLPEWHQDWTRKKDKTNLDVRGRGHIHADERSKPLAPKVSKFPDAAE